MNDDDGEMVSLSLRRKTNADVLALRLMLSTELEVALALDPSLAAKLRVPG